MNRRWKVPICPRCRRRRVYRGRLFCSRCRTTKDSSAIRKVDAMLAEYQERRASSSVTEDPNVYFVLNVYVDVLLSVRAELAGHRAKITSS